MLFADCLRDFSVGFAEDNFRGLSYFSYFSYCGFSYHISHNFFGFSCGFAGVGGWFSDFAYVAFGCGYGWFFSYFLLQCPVNIALVSRLRFFVSSKFVPKKVRFLALSKSVIKSSVVSPNNAVRVP